MFGVAWSSFPVTVKMDFYSVGGLGVGLRLGTRPVRLPTSLSIQVL